MDEEAVPRTVADVIRVYLGHTRHEQGVRTYEGRRRTLNALADALGPTPLAEAKPFHLRLWVDAQDHWKSDWTRKGAVSTVQRCFNWACKLGLIGRNPFHGVSHREGEPGRPMTEMEFRAALRSSSRPFRLVLVFLRFTGCRPGELSALEPSQVDLARSVAMLAEHKTSRTQKRRRPRVIVLHPVVVKLLAYLMRAMLPGQTKLFVNSHGGPWKRYGLATRMKRLRKKIGLPKDCKTYGLRHRFGTDAILHGVPLKTLAVLMGHTTTRTTERYVHIDNELGHLGEAVRRILGGPGDHNQK